MSEMSPKSLTLICDQKYFTDFAVFENFRRCSEREQEISLQRFGIDLYAENLQPFWTCKHINELPEL